MDSGRADDIDLLGALRTRFGNQIVDVMLAKGLLTPAPLTEAVRKTAQELLGLEPAATDSARARPEITRLRPASLLSNEFVVVSHMLDIEGNEQPGDDLEGALIALARRSYPAYLASAESTQNERTWEAVRLRKLPAHSVAVSAMKLEPVLAPLFEADKIESSFDDTTMWLHLYDPVELLLYSAWHLSLLRGERSQSSFVKALLEQLARLRTLCAGAAVHVPVFLGLGEMRIDTPVADASVHVRPYLQTAHDSLLDVSDRLCAQGGGVVVELSFLATLRALRAGVRVTGAYDRPLNVGEVGVPDFRHWVDCFAVAVALSKAPELLKPEDVTTPIDVGIRPQLRWMLNADPLFGGSSLHFSQGWKKSKQAATELGPTPLMRAAVLSKMESPSVKICVGRLSAALEYERRWSDCFLDAVIAWEALSGDCSGAVTMKTCAVVAHLAAAPTHRKQLREKVHKLYGKRSRVVHGGNAAIEEDDRAAAILVGLAALRGIVDDYPHLLQVDERFEALFLDAGG